MCLEDFDTSLQSFSELLQRSLPYRKRVYEEIRTHIFGFIDNREIRNDIATDPRSPVRNGVATLNGIISFLKSVERDDSRRTLTPAPENPSFAEFCDALRAVCIQLDNNPPAMDASYADLFFEMFDEKPKDQEPPQGWDNPHGPVMEGRTTLVRLTAFIEKID